MGRLLHRSELPSAGVSAASMRAARALSEHLLDVGELPPWPAGMAGLCPGEIMYRQWVGPRGSLYARDLTVTRRWRQLYVTGSLIVYVTSQRLRIIPGLDGDIPFGGSSASSRVPATCRSSTSSSAPATAFASGANTSPRSR